MKHTIEFTLPEETGQFQNALDADKLRDYFDLVQNMLHVIERHNLPPSLDYVLESLKSFKEKSGL
jgi:hypothetical protein